MAYQRMVSTRSASAIKAILNGNAKPNSFRNLIQPANENPRRAQMYAASGVLTQGGFTSATGSKSSDAYHQSLRSYSTFVNMNSGSSFGVLPPHYANPQSSPTQKVALKHRDQLHQARRVVVKLGSAVITRADGCGLALGRLASIVEQCAELQNEGRQMTIVTSGAVAFGKQKMEQELLMSLSMRETLSPKDPLRGEEVKSLLASRASAAVGQSGLMSLYEAMFAQYGVKVAQILITKSDFYIAETRNNLTSTINELLALNILPIINTNDAVSPPPGMDSKRYNDLDIKDNDSLAASLAAEMDSDLMILMTNVEGIYDKPPSVDGSRMLESISPEMVDRLEYGEVSNVGTGGMESKVKASIYALSRGTNVVICNGLTPGAIKDIVVGRKIGTFFTAEMKNQVEVQALAKSAKSGSKKLQCAQPITRSEIIKNLADSLITRQNEILRANDLDIQEASISGLSPALASRLKLNPQKLQSLAEGLKHISEDALTTIGKVILRRKISDGVILKKVTVPIGLLMVIFESRPDCLPQVAALAIATGNGLLLKGGKEAYHTNNALMKLVSDALSEIDAQDSIALISTREQISDLLQLDKDIDLVIPRGSTDMVRNIQNQSKNIPVMGHAEGICHVYVDSAANIDKAVKIVVDSKCDYPAACNAMETLLIHRDVYNDLTAFSKICTELKNRNVKIYAGPRMLKSITFGPPQAESFRHEYGDLQCTIEVVDSMDEAIHHIHTYGSSHTDVIVTENESTAERFLNEVDSACVFHNASSRMADGYRLGLGAEVGISTARIHARGPVGIEGLLTSKWVIDADCVTAAEFTAGESTYVHEDLPLQDPFARTTTKTTATGSLSDAEDEEEFKAAH